jgi:LmbE family N-acetylglucosaminyl deacetylase
VPDPLRRIPPAPLGVDEVHALGTTVLVWAHPDDETYLAGGLMAALRDSGRRVVCVTATRGEAGSDDDSPTIRDELRGLRTRELEAALEVLGVEEHLWLDHPDGGCASIDPRGPAARLAELLDDVRPDTVVTFGPDGFTGHADHKAVSRWASLAMSATATPRPLLLHAVATAEDRRARSDVDAMFDVHGLGQPRVCDPAELLVDLRPRGSVLQRKVAALRAQASQTGPVLDAIGERRFTEWVAAESFAAPSEEGRSAKGLRSPLLARHSEAVPRG